MEEGRSMSLFTEGHSHHSAVWTVTGVSVPMVCVACVIDRLGNRKRELTVRIDKVLKELSLSTTYQEQQTPLMKMMASDLRITGHICNVVIGLLSDDQKTIVQESLQILTNIMRLHPRREVFQTILLKSIQQALTSCTYSPSKIGHLTLIGSILHKDSSLLMSISAERDKLIEYLVDGFVCQDEAVKSSLVYILVQVCSCKSQIIQMNVTEKICTHLSVSLANAQSHDLTLNLMGLAKMLTSNYSYLTCLLKSDQPSLGSKGSTFASALKRVLLSGDEVVQLLGVQCITSVISHYPQYVPSLLSVDIAEYLFEALSSDNIPLINSILSCLNLICVEEQFYTGCHVIYGYQPIIKVLKKSLETRNEGNAKSCLTLLSIIFKRQPSTVPLLSNEKSITDFLSVLHSAIFLNHFSSVDLFSSFLKNWQYHTVSIDIVIPHLALLLQFVDMSFDGSVTKSGTKVSEEVAPKELLVAVLMTFDIFAQLFQNWISDTNVEEVYMFLCFACQETLIPLTLAICTDVEHNITPLQNLLTVLVIVIHYRSNPEFVLLLAQIGLIELAMESRGLAEPQASPLMEQSALFIEELVYILIQLNDNFDDSEAKILKETLHIALPHIKFTVNNSLNCLVQRINVYPIELAVMQASILCLFYVFEVYGELPVSRISLFSALSQYLNNNKDVHLLPVTTFKMLLALYALTRSSNSNPIVSDDIIVKGLLLAPSPKTLFVKHTSLLTWAYYQAPLQQCIARDWLQEWLVISSDYEQFLKSIVGHSSILIDHCLAIVANGWVECLEGVTNLLLKLLNFSQLQEEQLKESCAIRKLEVFFLMQMPLNEMRLVAILKAIQDTSIKVTIKLFCQILNVLENYSLEDLPSTIVMILQIIVNMISGDDKFQATSIVLSNGFVMNIVMGIIHKSSQFKTESLVASMLLLNKLIKNLSEDQRIMVNKDLIPFKLSCAVLLEHLCDDQISIIKCVLTLWTTIFSNNEQNTVWLKDYIAGSPVRTFQVLAFTLINLMANEREELDVEAVKCFQALYYHVSSDSSNISFELIICNDWLELLYSFFSIRYTDNLPLHFKELKNILINKRTIS